MRFRPWLAILLIGFAPAGAGAVNPASWSIDLSTTGQDVFWTSPTAVTTGLAEYDWSYDISNVTATLQLLGDRDVTDLLGDATSGSGTVPDIQIVLLDQTVDDETTGTAASVFIEVDSNGFGQAEITDITLGSLIGLNITRVRVQATINLVGYPYGDYDRDRDVDVADYNLWLANFGSTTHLDADGNGNSIVDAADYVVWRDHLGQVASAGSAAMVPEPADLAVWPVIGVAFVLWRRRRAQSDRAARLAS